MTRDEVATHRAQQLLPQKVEELTGAVEGLEAKLRLIELSLDQIVLAVETGSETIANAISRAAGESVAS